MFYEQPSAPVTGSTAPFKGYDYQELYDHFIPEIDKAMDAELLEVLHFFKNECKEHWYKETDEGLTFKSGVTNKEIRDHLYWISHDGIHGYYQKAKRQALFEHLESLDESAFESARTALDSFLEALIRQSDEQEAEIFLYLRGIKSRHVFLHFFKMNFFNCWS